MKHKNLFWAIVALATIAGCSSKHAGQYADVGGENALAHYQQKNGVSTQGLGDEQGYESLQRVQATRNSLVAKNNVFYFGFDKTSLGARDLQFVQQQAQYLLAHPQAKLFLGGHTDERGSREYNIGLGERRAKRVAELLQISGVPSKQYRIVSYGREKPQVYGHDEQAWRKNRRVEFIYENLG